MRVICRGITSRGEYTTLGISHTDDHYNAAYTVHAVDNDCPRISTMKGMARCVDDGHCLTRARIGLSYVTWTSAIL